MWTHFLWGFSAIISVWSCSSVGAYILQGSLDEPFESCPAGKLNAQHKTYYNANKINADEGEGRERCVISEKRQKPVQLLLLRIINIRGRMREPESVFIPRLKTEPRAELFKEQPVLEKPKPRLILVLKARPKHTDPANARFM